MCALPPQVSCPFFCCLVGAISKNAWGVDLEQSFPTPRLRSTGYPVIPRRLWFTYGSSFIEGNETPTHRFLNINNTASAYKEAWGEQSAKVDFLNDDQCATDIFIAEPRLLKYYQQETNLADRADICRTASLFLYGGYSFDFDDDLEVVEAYLPQTDSLSFVAVMSSAEGSFFHFFIASAPKHPILRQALSEMVSAYSDTRASGQLGPTTLRNAYDGLPAKVRGETLLLTEDELGEGYYPDLAKQHGWDPCTSVVHDPTRFKVFFFSSLVQNENCQPNASLHRRLGIKTRSPEIPHRIWFIDGPHFKRDQFSKENLQMIKLNAAIQGSKRKGAADILDNIKRIVHKYDCSWDNIFPRVAFLDKADCAYFILRVEPALSPYFQNEANEANREDMCRAAALYLHGGYAFDISLDAIEAYKPKDTVSLVPSLGCDGDCFSRAFLASARGHPVIKHAMEDMLRIYQQNDDTSHLGPRTLKNAFYSLPEGMRGEASFLLERSANENDFLDHPRQGLKEECDNVISHRGKMIFYRHDFSCDEQKNNNAQEESSGMVIVVSNQPKCGTGTIVHSIYRSLACKDYGHVERQVLRYDCRDHSTVFQTHDLRSAAKSLDDLRQGRSSPYDQHGGDDHNKTFHPEQHVEAGKCLVVTSVRDPLKLLPSWFSEQFKEVLKSGDLGPADVERMYRKFLGRLPRSNIRLYEETFDLLRAFGATNMTEELEKQEAHGGQSFLEHPDPDGPWRGCKLLFLRLEEAGTWDTTIAAAIHRPVTLHSTSTLGSHPEAAGLVERIKDPQLFASEIAAVVEAKPIFREIFNYYESSEHARNHHGQNDQSTQEADSVDTWAQRLSRTYEFLH